MTVIQTFTARNDNEETKKTIYEMVYGGLILYSFTLTSLLHQTVLVAERESNLRYILNFIGIRSTAYYLGNFLAELIVFAFISLSLIILSLILGLDAIN
jgi:hypothetical protein